MGDRNVRTDRQTDMSFINIDIFSTYQMKNERVVSIRTKCGQIVTASRHNAWTNIIFKKYTAYENFFINPLSTRGGLNLAPP